MSTIQSQLAISILKEFRHATRLYHLEPVIEYMLLFSPWQILICREDEGTGEQEWPGDQKPSPFRGAAGPSEPASVRWAGRKAGSDEVVPPAATMVCPFPPGERPHPSFDKNASVFAEIHLPLNRQLRCLGKAFGCRLHLANSKFVSLD